LFLNDQVYEVQYGIFRAEFLWSSNLVGKAFRLMGNVSIQEVMINLWQIYCT